MIRKTSMLLAVLTIICAAGAARALWEELDLYPLSVQSPWHGYGLGDWTDRWETFARRAATGDWELTGRETLARQREGLTPETPARFDEEAKKKPRQ